MRPSSSASRWIDRTLDGPGQPPRDPPGEVRALGRTVFVAQKGQIPRGRKDRAASARRGGPAQLADQQARLRPAPGEVLVTVHRAAIMMAPLGGGLTRAGHGGRDRPPGTTALTVR